MADDSGEIRKGAEAFSVAMGEAVKKIQQGMQHTGHILHPDSREERRP